MFRALFILSWWGMWLAWSVPWVRALTPALHAAPPWRVALVLSGWWLGTCGLALGAVRLRLRAAWRAWLFGGWLLVGLWTAFDRLLYVGAALPGNSIVRPLYALGDLEHGIPDEAVLALVLIAAGGHALHAATIPVSLSRARRGFLAGLFMLLAYLLLNTPLTGETPGSLGLLFLFAGLLAMSTARLAALDRLRGGAVHPADGRWLLALVGAAAGVVTVAAGLAALLSSPSASWLLRLPLGVAGVLLVLLMLVLAPLGLALLYLIYGLLVALLEGDIGPAIQAVLSHLQTVFDVLAEALRRWLAAHGDLLVWLWRLRQFGQPLFWLTLIGLTAWLTWLGVRWRTAGPRPSVADAVWEPLSSDAGLRSALWVGGRRLMQRLRQALRPGRRLAAARIRRWYARLMDLCARAGHPRPRTVTPLEFLPTLQALLPDQAEDARVLTLAYLGVRYGEQAESTLDLAAVEAAWRRLRAALQ